VSARRSASFVVRLLLEQAAAGEVVGSVEVVETGETSPLHDIDDFVEVAERVARRQLAIDP
jgi:hypothetical protein